MSEEWRKPPSELNFRDGCFRGPCFREACFRDPCAPPEADGDGEDEADALPADALQPQRGDER